MEIARVFLDVSMTNSFRGLLKIMSDAKMRVNEIPDGKFTIFINKRRTAFKLIVGKSYLVYCNNGSRVIPLEAIQNFPEFFDGRRLDLKGAVRKTIMSKVFMVKKTKAQVLTASRI